MSKDRIDDACIEHPNWKILINTKVRKILWDDNEERAIGVVVRDAKGDEINIFLKTDGRSWERRFSCNLDAQRLERGTSGIWQQCASSRRS